ncbi:MAG: PEP-CTERM sorting domain-containing protein [Verrucomicrobiota bacterium]
MKKQIILITAALAVASVTASALNIVEDFSTNPLLPGSGWTIDQGTNSNNQLAWDSSAHALNVTVNSSLPTVRLDMPFGTTLTMDTDFTLTTRFSFSITSAPGDQLMQFAFGLVNNTSTGGDRTGSFSNFGSDNAFNTVEFNYFPNVSLIYGGPTVAPTVMGAQKGSSDSFGNSKSYYGTSDPLPSSTLLQATLDYVSSTKTVTLTVQQVNPDQSLSLLNTTPISVSSISPSFLVNSLAIMSYFDGFTSSGDPSLVGEMTINNMQLTSPVPEPSSLGLVSIGIAGLFALIQRRRA